MPERYLKIKKSLVKQGKPIKQAKKIAATTYNKTRKAGESPVQPGVYERKMRSKK